MNNTEIIGKAPQNDKRSTLAFMLITCCAAVAVSILNATVLQTLFEAAASDVRTQNTVLPAALYYLISLFTLASLMLCSAGIIRSAVRQKTGYTVAAAALMFASLALCDVLPFAVAAVSYKSYTFFALISENATALTVRLLLELLRTALVLLAVLCGTLVCRAGAKKPGAALAPEMVYAVFAAVFLTLMPMLTELFDVTIPFIQTAGQNRIHAELPKILLEYLLYIVYGIAGFAFEVLLLSLKSKIGKSSNE